MEYDETAAYIFSDPEPLALDEGDSDIQASITSSDHELSGGSVRTPAASSDPGDLQNDDEEDEEDIYHPLYPDVEEGSQAGSEAEASDISEDDEPPNFPPLDEDVPEEELTANKFREATQTRRRSLNDEFTVTAVREVCKRMGECGIDLAIFLDALSWGTDGCIKDAKIKYQRTTLMQSVELPSILKRWNKPPRSSASMKRPAGATRATDMFAVDTAGLIILRELKALAPLLRLPAGRDVVSKELTSADIPWMVKIMKEKAPSFWNLVERILTEDTRAEKKDPEKARFVIIAIISTAAYHRSHHSNLLPKLLAIYLKFRGVSAKGFDMLHILGLTMSHKWACDAVERMSTQAMQEVSQMLEEYPWVLSYDNVNIPFRVFSQRIDNQSQLGHGTAATVYFKQDAAKLSEALNDLLKKQRAEGIKKPLTALEIMELDRKAAPKVEQRMVDVVLQMLLDTPEFDFKTYKDRDSEILHPSPPIDALPTGPEHKTLQYLLGTVDIPEVSYEDNSRLMSEWFRQLGFNTEAEQVKLAMKKVITWVGDQLTVDRLRRLFTFRADDDNSLDRMDNGVFIFGWLHLQMAFANSIHKQYWGTAQGRLLAQAAELLGKKKLAKSRTQGPFHHDIVETIYEVTEAHILEDWLRVGGVSTVAELREASAATLKDQARTLVKTGASTEALDKMDSEGNIDEVRRHLVMYTRDTLHYIVLDKAIKTGDVGLMETLLPYLLFRFVGGGNPKYANEVLELLQGLEREWPEELKDFVRHHCWLVNFSGKPGVWCPIDKAQEMNIKDIKVTYRSEGPNIKWEYLKKLHPAIPTIRTVIDFLEHQFGTLVRGKRHAVPSREKDILKLRKSYAASNAHENRPHRKIPNERDKAEDVVSDGAQKVMFSDTLLNWDKGRAFERSQREDWGSEGGSSDDWSGAGGSNGPSSTGEGSRDADGGPMATD